MKCEFTFTLKLKKCKFTPITDSITCRLQIPLSGYLVVKNFGKT